MIIIVLLLEQDAELVSAWVPPRMVRTRGRRRARLLYRRRQVVKVRRGDFGVALRRRIPILGADIRDAPLGLGGILVVIKIAELLAVAACDLLEQLRKGQSARPGEHV